MVDDTSPLPNLPLKMLQVREELVYRFRPILHHFGVTEQQWRILRVLCFRESMEPKEICDTCLFLSPSLAGVLNRMESDGLITKERMQSDLRRVRVRATPKAQDLVARVMPLIKQQYDLIEEAIGREAITQLFEALERFESLKGTHVPLVPLPALTD